MVIEKRTRLTATLPPTPCTSDMRAKVVAIAKESGVTIAEVQRVAMALFLSQSDSDTINLSNQSINSEAS